jgi:phenylalanyl-tRNA synthetase beta chain
VFDSFQGGSLPTGKKSVGFSMDFASPDRTLLGDEVDVLVSSVEAALATRVGGILRRTRV